MTEKYTPEKVAELVAEARKAYADDRMAHWIAEGGLEELADALTAVSAERDALQARITERDLLLSCAADAARASASTVDQVMSGLLAISNVQADRDRLHKAITEALDLTRPGASVPLGVSEVRHIDRLMATAHGILRAALDKEGDET